jgi:hypothetical protein
MRHATHRSTARRRAFFFATCALACTLAGLVGFAPTKYTRTDNFNDNFITPARWWELGWNFQNMTLAETNKRLEFKCNDDGGDTENFAGVYVPNWGVNWRRNFRVEFDFHLDLPNIIGFNTVVFGTFFCLENEVPIGNTGLGAGVIRDRDGLWLGIIHYEFGEWIEVSRVPLPNTSGRAVITWNRANDRMSIRVGNRVAHFDGFEAIYGLEHGHEALMLVQGCIASDGQFNFPGSRAYFDDWLFSGFRRGFGP